MGFDNECILNIQSLAGEYFCPVCRLLVYPNEALQTQCTHLYCKPCLTYVVSTTKSCPYDGYLVTEADSKPLLESNKALADTIGKIAVHCLYHRSGCTWQGPLSECTSHCSGCAFGNSPVVCNRCGIQIVHRQVQEHAQNCPGVHSQAQQADGAQDAGATVRAATGDQTQTASQAGPTSLQVQTSQTTNVVPAQNSMQQANSSSQAQAAVHPAAPTAEQWYQQQQQYQQYYQQQYPGYDLYQQHSQQYYPYQMQAVPQYQQTQVPTSVQNQPQAYVQPQPQPQPQPQSQPQIRPQVPLQAQSQPQSSTQHPQSHPAVQGPVVAQPHNQAPVNPQQQPPPMMQPQSQSQNQPQLHPGPHAHAQPQTYPHPRPHLQSQPNQPHAQQHMQIPQYQQPHSQIAHPQSQIQPQAPTQVHSQSHPVPQNQPVVQAQSQVQHHPQSLPQLQPQANLPLNPNVQPAAQHASAHAVSGHQSYLQPHPQHQMQLGAPQHTVPVYPPGGHHSQVQHPVQMQNPYPQQPSHMRPPQPHATIQNQQQTALLPSPGQVPNFPPSLQQSVHPHPHQAGLLIQQRPAMQPVQQSIPQHYANQPGPYIHQQMPTQSQLRPQGPLHSIQQQPHSYLQPQANAAFSHNMQPPQSQGLLGRPLMVNQGVQYTQSALSGHAMQMQLSSSQPLANQNSLPRGNNQVQPSTEQQPGATSKPIVYEKQGDRVVEKSIVEQVAESSSQKTARKDGNVSDSKSGNGADASEIRTPMSETDLKSADGKATSVDALAVVKTESIQTFDTRVESYVKENGEPMVKQIVKEEASDRAENQKDVDHKLADRSVGEDKKSDDGHMLKSSPFDDAQCFDEQSGKSQKEIGMPQAQGSQVLKIDEFRNFAQPGPVHTLGLVQPSHSVPVGDQGRHQPSSIHGPSSVQQKPAATSISPALPPGPPHQAQLPGHPPSQSRPQGIGHLPHAGQPFTPSEDVQSAVMKQPHVPGVPPGGIQGPGSSASFGTAPNHYGISQHNLDAQSLAAPGPHYQTNAPPLHADPATRVSQIDGGVPPFGAVPPSTFDSRGGMMMRAPHFAEGQMGSYMDGRRPDPQLIGMRMNGPPGIESSVHGLKDEKPLPHELLRRADFEEDLKQFPRPSQLNAETVMKFGSNFSSSRPLDRASHGFGMDGAPRPHDKGPPGPNFDTGLKIDPLSSSAASRFLPPHHSGGMRVNGAGERPIGMLEGNVGRPDTAHPHSDFLGPVPGYGRRHMDGISHRSPVGEYSGIPSRDFVGFPGRLGSRQSGFDEFESRYDGPIGNSFHDSRFPILPGHFRRGDFEGSGDFRMDERSDHLIGQDYPQSHFRRGGEYFGPHNLPGHSRMGDPVDFDAFPGHARMGDLAGPGKFPHPRLGEPGFRSSFSLQGFPNDAGIYAGNMEPFENSRKRKPATMGWCRICKVDCETVEGLDLHSQSREHQKMAMDMVMTIKKNAKKQKLDRSSLDDGSKLRNAKFGSRGKKR